MAEQKSSEAAKRGRSIRQKVLGKQHVERSDQYATDFDRPFLRFITEGVWGQVWARKHLPLRERSMITTALLAAAGNLEELAMHVRATANTGATEKDIQEVLLHVAAYAGVPKANAAFAVAKRTLSEMDKASKAQKTQKARKANKANGK